MAYDMIFDLLGDPFEDCDGPQGEAFWFSCRKAAEAELLKGRKPAEVMAMLEGGGDCVHG